MAGFQLTVPPNEAVIRESRSFRAPRVLVWKAMTEPFHFSQWWGPHGYTNPVCELDVRPGGKWYVEQRDRAGRTFKFHGEFIEVEPPRRIVQTFAFADYPSARMEFELSETGGLTILTGVMHFDSLEMRNGMVASGMEEGARESYERLDEILAAMQAGTAPA